MASFSGSALPSAGLVVPANQVSSDPFPTPENTANGIICVYRWPHDPNTTPKLLSHMNSYNNLDPSLFHRHDAHTMPHHDLSHEYPCQVHQEMTQNYSTFHQPPGAESLPRRHTEIGEQASRMMNAQTDESNKSFYSSSPSRSASLSPSQSYPLQVPVSEVRHLPASQSPSYTPNSTSQNPPYTHVRPNSQPPPTPTMVLGDGNDPANASPYTNAPQITSPLSKLSSTTTTVTPAGVDIPLLPLPGSLRRYSETDAQNVQNAHDVLSVYGTANPTMYPSLPESSGFSPESSSAQSFSSEFTDTTPGPAHGGGSFTLMNLEDPFPPSTSPDSTDDSAGSTLSGPPQLSIFTPGSTPPIHIPDHHHHQVSLHCTQATTSSSSLDRQLERAQRRNARRRSEPPRDQKATNRLSDQRRLDDENTEALYKLFVPPGAEVKWKKDRLGIILYYANRLVDRYNRLVEYCEHTRDAREQMLAQSDEGLRQNQEQLFSRHGDFSRQVEHWVSTNNSLDRALTNGEHEMHHQQYNSATDDRHDSSRL